MDLSLSQVRWTHAARGLFKNLAAFDKKRHTPPTAATPAAAAFLAKLTEQELAAEAEQFFQRTRVALNYKRKEITLSAGGGAAVLQTKDFLLEWDYAVAPDAPEEWVLTRALHGVRSGNILALAEFDDLFAGSAGFSALEFQLEKPVRVEDVIDVVEALDTDAANASAAASDATGAAAGAPNTALRVEYPSDCSQCELHVEGVEAKVVFTGATLRMEFPAQDTPNALAEQFLRVRTAFALTKSPLVAGLAL
ncbi:MAG: hypothetical protein LBR07_02675 [Puniceicoccales bacterium]|jgi:hypothetical protein|nr:hypothetical protein [Puniceicoccales bacterium]